jgi:hypothetical protein
MPHPGYDEEREARRAVARRRLGLAMGRLVVIETLMAMRAPSGGVGETPAAGRMSSAAPEGEPADQAPDPPADEQGEEGRQAGA